MLIKQDIWRFKETEPDAKKDRKIFHIYFHAFIKSVFP